MRILLYKNNCSKASHFRPKFSTQSIVHLSVSIRFYIFVLFHQACQIISASTVRCMGIGTEIAPSHLPQQTCTRLNPNHKKHSHSVTTATTPGTSHGRPHQAINVPFPPFIPPIEGPAMSYSVKPTGADSTSGYGLS